MTIIAVSGHASLDHVALIDGAPVAGRTTTILDRPAGAWPRLGGSPAFLATALVEGGIAQAYPVSFVGDDEDGREYARQLAASGVRADGIARISGARTPIAILAYQPDGGALCFYDAGMDQDLVLNETQAKLVRDADWACVTIGPPSIADAVLATMRPQAKLAWVVKNDPRSISPEQASRLAARASLICCSEAERGFLDAALAGAAAADPDRIVIETRGRAGASFTRGAESVFVPAEPVEAGDPTGAGDTFAGGVLAALARGETRAEAIVGAGHKAARKLLAGRVERRDTT